MKTLAPAMWSALGEGMNGAVLALAFDDQGRLYAGGYFITAGAPGSTASPCGTARGDNLYRW